MSNMGETFDHKDTVSDEENPSVSEADEVSKEAELIQSMASAEAKGVEDEVGGAATEAESVSSESGKQTESEPKPAKAEDTWPTEPAMTTDTDAGETAPHEKPPLEDDEPQSGS